MICNILHKMKPVDRRDTPRGIRSSSDASWDYFSKAEWIPRYNSDGNTATEMRELETSLQIHIRICQVHDERPHAEILSDERKADDSSFSNKYAHKKTKYCALCLTMQKFAYLKVDIRGTKVIEYSHPKKQKRKR